MRNKCIIEVNDLFFKYKKSAKYALNGISLRVNEGEFLTIVGPNKSGKTTLALSLVGIIPHYIEGEYHGKVFIDGLEVSSSTILDITTRVGFIMEDPEMQIVGLTVKDDVSFGPCNLGLPREEVLHRIKWALTVVGLQGYENRITYTLSSGEKQRLAIAGVLALNPKIVIADEPTSRLDPVGKINFFKTLLTLNKEFKRTIVVFTHDLDLAIRFSDKIGLMYAGNLVFMGNTKEFLTKIKKEELMRYGIKPSRLLLLYEELIKYRLPTNKDLLWLDINEISKLLNSLVDKMMFSNFNEVKENEIFKSNNTNKESIIIVKNLWYIYPGGVEALKGISLTVDEGDFVAIIGSNGSGKTTLIKHLNGLLKPTRGCVLVYGIDTREKDVIEFSQKIGYLSQNPDDQIVFSLTVKENIALGLKDRRLHADEIKKRIYWVLNLFNIKEFENEFPSKLSKVERRLLALASIVAMKPDILIVDEPTSELDWNESQKVMKILKSYNDSGHTIILVTHDIEIVAEYAKKVVVMHKGKILAHGNPRDILYNEDLLSQVAIEPTPIVRLVKNYFKERRGLEPLTLDEILNQIIKYGGQQYF